MEFVYLLLNSSDWEDIIVFVSKEEAIKESKNNPKSRVEIFGINNNNEYIPTYNYYKNGIYIEYIKQK
jgi:hypothetical protein